MGYTLIPTTFTHPDNNWEEELELEDFYNSLEELEELE